MEIDVHKSNVKNNDEERDGMKKYYCYAGLFNYISGCLLFFVLSLWLMSFIYIAEALGWIMDPTLDEGLLSIFLILALTVSLIYFPALIVTNMKLSRKISLGDIQYALAAVTVLIIGFASFFGFLYFR